MNPVTIQYTWQAIQDSERSDGLPFLDPPNRSLLRQPDRPGAPDRAPLTMAADPWRTVTLAAGRQQCLMPNPLED